MAGSSGVPIPVVCGPTAAGKTQLALWLSTRANVTIVSADSLADFVWGDAKIKARRGVVEVYISYLRRKLAASRQVKIGTVRGAGYRFEPRQ